MSNRAALEFSEIDVDNIYSAAHVAYWGAYSQIETKTDGTVTRFRIRETETDKVSEWIGAKELAKATREVLNGNHVGSYLVDQCRKDITEWVFSPKYGVPFDSELSDYLIQIAFFGEVVYS